MRKERCRRLEEENVFKRFYFDRNFSRRLVAYSNEAYQRVH